MSFGDTSVASHSFPRLPLCQLTDIVRVLIFLYYIATQPRGSCFGGWFRLRHKVSSSSINVSWMLFVPRDRHHRRVPRSMWYNVQSRRGAIVCSVNSSNLHTNDRSSRYVPRSLVRHSFLRYRRSIFPFSPHLSPVDNTASKVVALSLATLHQAMTSSSLSYWHEPFVGWYY